MKNFIKITGFSIDRNICTHMVMNECNILANAEATIFEVKII